MGTTTTWRSRTRGAPTVPRSGSRPCGSVGDARPRREFIESSSTRPRQANASGGRLPYSNQRKRRARRRHYRSSPCHAMEADPSADRKHRAAIEGRRDLPRAESPQQASGLASLAKQAKQFKATSSIGGHVIEAEHSYLTQLEVVEAGGHIVVALQGDFLWAQLTRSLRATSRTRPLFSIGDARFHQSCSTVMVGRSRRRIYSSSGQPASVLPGRRGSTKRVRRIGVLADNTMK